MELLGHLEESKTPVFKFVNYGVCIYNVLWTLSTLLIIKCFVNCFIFYSESVTSNNNPFWISYMPTTHSEPVTPNNNPFWISYTKQQPILKQLYLLTTHSEAVTSNNNNPFRISYTKHHHILNQLYQTTTHSDAVTSAPCLNTPLLSERTLNYASEYWSSMFRTLSLYLDPIHMQHERPERRNMRQI